MAAKLGASRGVKLGSSCHLLQAEHLLIHLCFCAASVSAGFQRAVASASRAELLLKLRLQRHQERSDGAESLSIYCIIY